MNTLERIFVLLLCLSLSSSVLAFTGSTAQATPSLLQPPQNLSQIALQLVAQRLGLPTEDVSFVESTQPELSLQGKDRPKPALVSKRDGKPYLIVANTAVAEFPEQGKSAYSFKIIDARRGEILGIDLDESGQEIDLEAWISTERAMTYARYGRLDPQLAERISAEAMNEELIPVIIWLKEPPYTPRARPNPKKAMNQAELAQTQREAMAHRAEFVASITSTVSNRLKEKGLAVKADRFAPVLYTKLPPSALLEVALWDEVDTIYLDEVQKPELEVARAAIQANQVHSLGITGTGVKVAQIEVGGRVATGNPYLSGVIQNTTYVCASVDSHSTGVAGIIRSTHTSRRGIAYGATLWAGGSCDGISSQLQNRSNVAINWGARILNISWGTNTNRILKVNDRFFDSLVINAWKTVIISSGNEGGSCNSRTGNVTSPGLAYNVITVGNFNDHNTLNWGDDTMNSCSSYVDPRSVHNDREKPEVAAPGTAINSTTTSYPWTGAIGSGTSFAAPMVSGISVLLMQQINDYSLWPETIKAIVMASAIHNIEGASHLSEKDGAGGVVANEADNVVRGIRGNWGSRNYSCFTSDPLTIGFMSLKAGKKTRVVIVWDNDPAWWDYANRPSTDLDLKITGPEGFSLWSSGLDNSYEIAEFTPTVSGIYTIIVDRYRCDYNPRYLAWAWWRAP